MNADEVRQLSALSDMFRDVLRTARPASVVVMGVAGGNGLEHIDSSVTGRVCGVDINPDYLDAVRERFETLPGLELRCVDLSAEIIQMPPAELVHAALFFEHAGCGLALENSLALLEANGLMSVVLQLPSERQQGVAPTQFASMQSLSGSFRFVNPEEFVRTMEAAGFRLTANMARPLPSGKALWHGLFAR